MPVPVIVPFVGKVTLRVALCTTGFTVTSLESTLDANICVTVIVGLRVKAEPVVFV